MSFLDLRQWMNLLEQRGELRRIKAEMDWDAARVEARWSNTACPICKVADFYGLAA